MFLIIAFIFIGIGLGYTIRIRTATASRRRIGIVTSKATTGLIWFLLFLLGIEVGSNERITSALPTLGAEALLLSTCSVLGSCILAWALWRSTKGKNS